MAQTTADDFAPQPAPLDGGRATPLDWTLNLTRVSWEVVAWLALAPLALLLRLIWLDAWPMRAQEAAVASTAWALLARGQVTAPLPTEAGPVVTLITSFCFFLFGASDQTARLGAALAGTGLVVACWWLRPFVGRVGALLAALLLTWSPLTLYPSRELTPEPFAALCLLVLALCLLRLRAGAGRATLLVAAAAVTLAVFSHYPALPLAVLLIALVPLAGRLAAPPAPPAEPAAARRARRAGAEAAEPPADEATGAPRLAPPALTRADWLLAAAVAGGLTAIIALLASTGGVDLLGNLLSPLTGWITAGAPLDRAPLYLPLLLLVYEPLLLVGALASAWTVGGARETAAHRLTGLLLVFWATAALLLAALAGDRDAAQALYPIVPLALLAGRVIGDLVANLPWERYLKQRGLVLSGVSALAIVALLVFISMLTGGGSGAVPANYAITLLLDFILCLTLVGAAIYLIRPLGYRLGSQVVLLTVLAFLALYGVRSAVQLAYVQPASAVELAVQEQPAPGLLSVVERIERLSRDLTGLRRTDWDVTGGHGLDIAVDRALALPFDWYLRAYPARSVIDPASGLSGNPSVVIVASGGEGALRAALDRGYVGQRYPYAWSFPAGGIGGGPKGLVRYLLYREPVAQPAVTEYGVYLRRDLADKVLFKGVGGAEAAPSSQAAANLFDRAGKGRAAGQFNSPRGIAVDAQGNLYIVNTANARVQKFDAEGNHQWTVGGAGSGPGQFARVQNGPGPTGIAVDSQGNVYVADTWNHRIVKLDPQGKVVTAWGTFFNGQGDAEQNKQHPREFYGPRSIAIGPDNALYVTDTGNKRVLVFDAQGNPLRQFGGLGAGPANLNEPVGIAIDAAGIVYVADTHNGRVATFDAQGLPLIQWPVAGWGPNSYQEPYIAVAGDTVYVSNGPGRSVLLFDKQGKPLGEERRPNGQELLNPTGIVAAPDGAVYVVDTNAHAVTRLK